MLCRKLLWLSVLILCPFVGIAQAIVIEAEPAEEVGPVECRSGDLFYSCTYVIHDADSPLQGKSGYISGSIPLYSGGGANYLSNSRSIPLDPGVAKPTKVYDIGIFASFTNNFSCDLITSRSINIDLNSWDAGNHYGPGKAEATAMVSDSFPVPVAGSSTTMVDGRSPNDAFRCFLGAKPH